MKSLTFTVPAPAAKKNRGAIIRSRSTGRLRYLPNQQATQQEHAIRGELEGRVPHEQRPLLGDDDVRVDIVHHARRDEVTVRVESVRPRPSGFSGRKRDLSNLTEVLLDALQGPVIVNDNQCVEIHLKRELN